MPLLKEHDFTNGDNAKRELFSSLIERRAIGGIFLFSKLVCHSEAMLHSVSIFNTAISYLDHVCALKLLGYCVEKKCSLGAVHFYFVVFLLIFLI